MTFGLFNQESWVKDALCVEHDPEMFYPTKSARPRNAKRVCGSPEVPNCPVREECLEYALANDEQFGIWGGKALRERRQIKRDRGRVRSPRTHCTRGHNLEHVGRWADGRCGQCATEWERARYHAQRRRDGVA